MDKLVIKWVHNGWIVEETDNWHELTYIFENFNDVIDEVKRFYKDGSTI